MNHKHQLTVLKILINLMKDWKAATERHNTGDIYKSIEINKDRFKLDNQIVDIFNNTTIYLNWDK